MPQYEFDGKSRVGLEQRHHHLRAAGRPSPAPGRGCTLLIVPTMVTDRRHCVNLSAPSVTINGVVAFDSPTGRIESPPRLVVSLPVVMLTEAAENEARWQ